MNYEIKLSSKAKKFVKNLQKNIKLRIIEKLKEFRKNPFRFLEHYEGNFYKLRIGNYRALVDIDFKNKIIYIEVLDKRERVYKNKS